MQTKLVYGPMGYSFEQELNQHLRNGWHILHISTSLPEGADAPVAAMVLGDEPPYDNWVGRNGVQRVGATWEA